VLSRATVGYLLFFALEQRLGFRAVRRQFTKEKNELKTIKKFNVCNWAGPIGLIINNNFYYNNT
jgi:hypothetical protein